MQRRIEQAHDDRQAVYRLEHAVEVARLGVEQIVDRLLAHVLVLVEDEGLDDLLAIAQEHVLGAAQADALRAEVAGQLGVLGVVGVGAHAQGAELVGPLQDGVQIAGELGHDQLDRAEDHDALGAIDRDHVAFLDDDVGAGDGGLLLLGVDLERLDTADAGGAHAASDDGRMAGLAAMAGQDALSGNHTLEVIRIRFPAHENDRMALVRTLDGVIGAEHDLTHRSARARVQSARQHLKRCRGIELRMEELIELAGIDALYCRFAVDEALFNHLDSDAERRSGGALAGAGLQHPKFSLLNGELNVAHVMVAVLEDHKDALQILGRLRERWIRCQILDGLGVANACDDVLALRVHEEVAIALALACCGVAREGDARSRALALVAVGHGLYVHGRAKAIGDAMLLTIDRGALVHPASEDRLDGKLELNLRILWEDDAALLHEFRMSLGVNVRAKDLLELLDELMERRCAQLRIGADSRHEALFGQRVLEQVRVDSHHHV